MTHSRNHTINAAPTGCGLARPMQRKWRIAWSHSYSKIALHITPELVPQSGGHEGRPSVLGQMCFFFSNHQSGSSSFAAELAAAVGADGSATFTALATTMMAAPTRAHVYTHMQTHVCTRACTPMSVHMSVCTDDHVCTHFCTHAC